ncbi:MAG: hypothetical protein AB1810_03600 [Pseudomonadota bacterium]
MDSATRTRRADADTASPGHSPSSRERTRSALEPSAPDVSAERDGTEAGLCSVPRYLGTEVAPPATPPSDYSSEEFIANPSAVDAPNASETPLALPTSPPSAAAASNPAAEAEARAEAEAGAGRGPAEGGAPTAPDASAEGAAPPATGERAEAGGAAAAASETAADEPSAVPREAARERRAESQVSIPLPIIARVGNIRAPRVPPPPQEAIKRSAEIRTRTGSPPEMHHAKVEQAVLRVVETARASQRQIVWRVGILARDTRLSIDQLANEILGFVAHCVGRIRSAIDTAKTDITSVVDGQIEHISTQGQLTDEALRQSQRDSQAEVHEVLLSQSDELNEAHTTLQQEFDPYLTEAEINTMNISEAGVVTHVTPPAGGAAPGTGGGSASMSSSTGGEANVCTAPAGPRQNLPELDTETQGTLSTLHGRDRLGAFYSTRSAPVYERQSQQTQERLDQMAVRQSESLESFRGQFTNYALRLVTPVARDLERDERGDSPALACEVLDERHSLAEAAGENGRTLMQKFDGVMRYLDNELGPRLIDGLNEGGAKAAKSFRDQGEATERMMDNTAAGFADAYPQLVARVQELLPDKQLLNFGELGPRLQQAWESARRLPDQQYQAMAEQAAATLQQMREAQQKQIEGLGSSAEKSLQSVTDVVTATSFDLETFGYGVTGAMREGGWAAITGASEYALRMATDLLKTRGQADGALNNLLRSFVESLNGAMDNFGNSYFETVDGFKHSVIDIPTGVFARIQREIDTDLSERSGKLNSQLTKPDTDTTTGLVVLNVLTLGATTAVTAGYLIYMDADDDEIFATLGNLQWPGPPALDQYFTTPGNYGNLQDRLRDCLSEDAARRAVSLFSADAGTRAAGRLEAVQDSFSLFGLDSDARQSLLQGFGAEERAAADPNTVAEVSQSIRDSWFASHTDIRLNEAYLRGNYGAALSARVEASLRTARNDSSDAIFQSVQNIETLARSELALTGSATFIDPNQVQSLTDQAMQDFAAHRPGETRAAADISVSEARQTFITTATAAMERNVGEGPPVMIPVDQMVQDYVREVITGGWENPEARAARQAYEFQHAGRGLLGPSESDQVRFTRAFENPDLARLERELREHPERRDEIMPQLDRARREHAEQMRRVLRRLYPELTDDEINAAGGPTAVMAQRSAELFAGHSFGAFRTAAAQAEDAQYAREMITGGRASLAAGVRIATRGAGTNEDLLRMTYSGRSKTEIAEARTIWQDRYGEDLDVMLGIKPRRLTTGEALLSVASPALGMFLYGGETSGDLAMELERSARGEPETDQDYIELAALTYAQQRTRGTGFLARLTMGGTPEARSMDETQRAMAETLLAEAHRRRAALTRDPNMSGIADAPLPEDPRAVFLPDGRIDPTIAALVFAPGPGSGGRPGADRFLGDRGLILGMSQNLELAGARYKAELDRQESLLLSAIAILAVIATVVLMAFGVGFVLASVLVALGSGLLTMAVKSGMRGERYGWEEAATDMAQTAIEVAAAGAGGALGGGLGKANALARVGQSLVARFGPIGGVIAREAIVGAVSSAAQVAIRDETYRDGPGAAVGRILGGGLKGAAISAVSAGVSERLGGGLNRRLNASLQQADASLLARLGQSLGPAGRNMLKEGVSEALGGIAGEATGILIEISSNQFHGSLKDALKRLGQAGLRDLVQSAGRAGATAHNRARYNRLMADARNATHLTDSDLHALRSAARSAGEFPESLESIRRQVQADRAVLAQLPPEIRRHAADLDSQSLHQLADMLHKGELAAPSDTRAELFMHMSERNPQLNAATLLRQLETASARLVPEPQQPEQLRAREEHQQQIRSGLTADLPGPVRDALADIPVHGLDQIPPHLLPEAARLIARGTFDPRRADALLLAARQHNPELDAVSFLRNLHSAVQSAQLAGEAHARILTRQRVRVLRDIPSEAHGLFARLPDEALGQLRVLLDQGQAGSPEQQAALLRQARELDPNLDGQQFRQMLELAAANATQRRGTEQAAARAERQQHMSNVPEHLRGTLSLLPDAALVELRLRQLEGSLSPAERLKLQEAALREQPDLDLPAFHKALDEAVARGAPLRPDAGLERRMWQELVAAVPEAQRHLVQNAPVVIMRDAEFAAYTRSAQGDAVTLMLNGRAVVIVRQGADPAALREEGIHVLQSRDPQWTRRMGSLDEQHLRHWDDLPLEQQMALYRNKLELELDAHDRLISSLTGDLLRASDPVEIAALRSRLELAQTAQSNLQNRLREVGGISPLQRQLISAGMAPRPQWLDQPARLFAKQPQAPPLTRQQILEQMTDDLAPGGSEFRKVRARLNRLDAADLNVLARLGLSAAEMRSVVLAHKETAATTRLIGDLRAIADAVPAGTERAVLAELVRRADLSDLAPVLRDAATRALDADAALTLMASVLLQPSHHLALAENLRNFLAQASPAQQADLVRLIDDIGIEGQGSLLRLLGELRSRISNLSPNNNDPHSFAATLIGLAANAGIKQKVDLINRTHDLLAALEKLPRSPERDAVVNHIVDGLLSGADPHGHALDIRAAARAVADGELAPATLQRFAENIKAGPFMSGGDAFRLHVEECLKAWGDFSLQHPMFADLLKRVTLTPPLTDEHRALLTEMEPWFSHIVASDWFAQRMKASGRTPDQEMLDLLQQILTTGLRGQTGITNFDTLRHIMQELRLTVVDTLAEPDLIARVRAQMERAGYSPEDIARRESDADAILRRDRVAGLVTPEVHLENLIRQQVEYQGMIDTAVAIAKQRYPNDPTAERALFNELTAGLRQKVTETAGEIAATRAIRSDPRFGVGPSNPESRPMELLRGFEAGIGFDQVWVRRDASGRITEILVVEAKGPGATTAQTKRKGAQMSAEWVARTAADMVMRGDDGTGSLILEALRTGHPPIGGVIVQAADQSGTPGSITGAPGTSGPHHHFDLGELRQHNPIKDLPPAELAAEVRTRIDAIKNGEFEFRYTDTEVNSIVQHGRSLGLSTTEIMDLMFTGSRTKKAIPAAELLQQMSNYVNIVSARGFPFRFDSVTDFANFCVDLKQLLIKYGIPAGDVRIQGSSLRTPEAKDVNIAVFIPKETFDTLTEAMIKGLLQHASPHEAKALADTVREQIAEGRIQSLYFDRIGERSFNQELRDLTRHISGSDNIDLSLMLRGMDFDVSPIMKI